MSKKNIPMYAACVLLCLTLITTYMTSGLYARYTASGEMYDGARVAEFNVTDKYTSFRETLRIDIAPGEQYTAAVAVTNDSEVAINYKLAINNETGNIPLDLKVSGDGGKSWQEPPYSGYNMKPGSGPVIYSLNIEFEDKKAMDYMGMVDLITIDLNAEQID